MEVLRTASDDELLLFLLQLVQALRYEPVSSAPVLAAAAVAPVTNVVDFALEQSIVGINHLTMRSSAENVQAAGDSVAPTASLAVSTMAGVEEVGSSSSTTAPQKTGGGNSNLSPLGKFLIDRACSSPFIANYLYWYLKVETQLEEEKSDGVFSSMWETFVVQLSESKETHMLYKRLMVLDDYITQIALVHREARTRGKRRDGKEQTLVKLLEAKGLESLPVFMEWVPMPLDPSIKLTGLVASTVKMFASAVYPVVIEFKELVEPVEPPAAPAGTSSSADAATNLPPNPPSLIPPAVVKPKSHKIMFKSGDDLRQDQLIMQMISLMDSLLKRVNLDLKLLTYGILAVGQTDGIMEFVQNSMPISAILKNFGSITEYLRHHNPDKKGPYEIAPLYVIVVIRSLLLIKICFHGLCAFF